MNHRPVYRPRFMDIITNADSTNSVGITSATSGVYTRQNPPIGNAPLCHGRFEL